MAETPNWVYWVYPLASWIFNILTILVVERQQKEKIAESARDTMESVWQLLFSWPVIGAAVGILIGVGWNVVNAIPPDVTTPKVCFSLAAVLLLAKSIIWLSGFNGHRSEKIGAACLIFALVGGAWMWSLDWVYSRRLPLVAQAPDATKPQNSQITLKQLFLTDFGPHLNRSRWDDRTLTVGGRTNKFPSQTMTFTPQLWIDFHGGNKFLGFYIPIQDKDPEKSSGKTVLLCKYLPDQVPAVIQMLSSLHVTMPQSRGSTVSTDNLILSKKLYIYHEDFIDPKDLGDLVRLFEAKQFLVEFRGQEYLSSRRIVPR
jgi:hypothetical protein